MAKGDKQQESKVCFVICPIGQPGSLVRKRADQVREYIIEPTASALGYTTIRADDESDPGLITRSILRRLSEADIVVADLTDHNPNVFYELAVRHAAHLPVIQIIEVEWEIPLRLEGHEDNPVRLQRRPHRAPLPRGPEEA